MYAWSIEPSRLFLLFASLILSIRLLFVFNQLRFIATTTYADLSLGPAKDVADLSHFYPAELIMQSRLVEDTGASRPMQGMATIASR